VFVRSESAFRERVLSRLAVYWQQFDPADVEAEAGWRRVLSSRNARREQSRLGVLVVFMTAPFLG
jgi:hypothetical protein